MSLRRSGPISQKIVCATGIASVRLSLADVPTSSELQDHLDRLSEAIERMTERLDKMEAARQKQQ